MTSSEQWNINEMLLQSYRSYFISFQSIFLAVGAFLFGKDIRLSFLLFLIGVLSIWLLWAPVVRFRRRAVDFYKYQYLKPKLSPPCDEGEYLNNAAKREAFNKLYGVKTNLR